MISSPLDIGDMYSSSESISLKVTGVGGAAGTPAEATILFWGGFSVCSDEIVASAAFRFLVVGGIVTVGCRETQEACRSRTRRLQGKRRRWRHAVGGAPMTMLPSS